MRFLIDAQLPPALARWLVSVGHDAEHVADLGLAEAKDSVIWAQAILTSSTLITKDEDFAQRRTAATTGPQIVWIRLPNSRKAPLLMWFSASLPRILEALLRGETLVEVTSPGRTTLGRPPHA